jgi:alanine racemase
VTMDQVMLDCGDDEVEVDDEVVLLGGQGSERIGANELAALAGTIGYEIVTSIGRRIPREYRG